MFKGTTLPFKILKWFNQDKKQATFCFPEARKLFGFEDDDVVLINSLSQNIHSNAVSRMYNVGYS